MLSGLYGDLPEAKTSTATPSGDTTGWAQKASFAPPVRKPAQSSVPRSVLGGLRKSTKPSGQGKSDGTQAVGSSLGQAPTGSSGLLGSATKEEEFVEEYDPARPNEYEQVRKDRERQRHEAQEEADRQEELRLLQEQDRKADEVLGMPVRPEDRDAALSLTGEEAFLRRGRLGKGGPQPGSDANASSSDFAQRMMQKMGWKEGQGLGKSQQGIATPLEAHKTDHRSAIIRNAAPAPREESGPPDKRQRGVAIQSQPSRVVLLRNIVGPGEVDDTLDDEIGEECSKYGPISQITIFEVTEPNYPPEEAVRIFVEFERQESAVKALIDLDGRFFGGRTVKAVFFSEVKFEKQDLAPDPNNPD